MIKLPASTKTQGIIIVSLVYIVFLVVGMLCYKDFGLSVDEWDLRLLGFTNLKYIMEMFFQSHVSELDKILLIPDTLDKYATHGAIFALPMAFVEYFFNITESQ